MIKDLKLREEIRQYYSDFISNYNNTDTLVGLLPSILSRIAKNFLKDLPSFSNFFRSSLEISTILSPYIVVCKGILKQEQVIKDQLTMIYYQRTPWTSYCNNNLFGSGRTYDPFEFENDSLQKALSNYEAAKEELEGLYEDAEKKMTF